MMKSRIAIVLLIALTLLLTGLSVGAKSFLVVAVILLLVVLLSYLSVLRTARTLTIRTQLTEKHVVRGSDVAMEVQVTHKGLMPVAPIQIELLSMPEMPGEVLHLRYAPGKKQTARIWLHAAHVGVCQPGLRRCVVEDLFGLFTYEWKPADVRSDLLVLPQTFDVAALTFAPGDPGMGTMARATEDITSPSDVRGYVPGDPMKKIHWKLSLRKRELLVRRFEEPVLPDALVLMDCSRPPADAEEEAADLQDALLETAASVMVSQEHSDHVVRMPLWGEHPIELEKGMGMPIVLENLARVDFSVADRFERMLTWEMRRIRSVGALVVISARLNGDIVEAIVRMRRMGPVVRLYLITTAPDAPEMMPFIHRLQRAEVEVCYVRPLRM